MSLAARIEGRRNDWDSLLHQSCEHGYKSFFIPPNKSASKTRPHKSEIRTKHHRCSEGKQTQLKEDHLLPGVNITVIIGDIQERIAVLVIPTNASDIDLSSPLYRCREQG